MYLLKKIFIPLPKEFIVLIQILAKIYSCGKMKKIKLLLLFTIFLSLFSCNKGMKNDSYLNHLDSLAESNPPLALKRIEKLEKSHCYANIHGKMLVNLIKYKAEDKDYVLHTSDSTVMSLNNYFQKHGTIYERLQCFYYAGSTYRDMDDLPTSILWYGKAVELAETNNLNRRDSVILARVYSQLADANYRIGENRKAFSLERKAYGILKKIDRVSLMTLEDMGRFADAAGEKMWLSNSTKMLW